MKNILYSNSCINVFCFYCNSSNVLDCPKGVRLQILTAVSMKFTVFWDVAPCSHVEVDRFRGAYCLHHQGPETSVNFNITTQRYIPED
jgi:hypothetical protein